MPSNELMTPKEVVATWPQIFTQRRLKDLRRRRAIPYIRGGHRTIAYRRRDIERFLAQRSVHALPER